MSAAIVLPFAMEGEVFTSISRPWRASMPFSFRRLTMMGLKTGSVSAATLILIVSRPDTGAGPAVTSASVSERTAPTVASIVRVMSVSP
jgi:hypothetical protein